MAIAQTITGAGYIHESTGWWTTTATLDVTLGNNTAVALTTLTKLSGDQGTVPFPGHRVTDAAGTEGVIQSIVTPNCSIKTLSLSGAGGGAGTVTSVDGVLPDATGDVPLTGDKIPRTTAVTTTLDASLTNIETVVSNHVTDTVKHTTQTEKDGWDAKAETSYVDSEVAGRIPKVNPAVAGNVPTLTSSGEIQDSGVALSSLGGGGITNIEVNGRSGTVTGGVAGVTIDATDIDDGSGTLSVASHLNNLGANLATEISRATGVETTIQAKVTPVDCFPYVNTEPDNQYWA